MTFTFNSCDDGFAEMNVNPNQANSIDPTFQFPLVQLRTSGGRYENWRAGLIYSSTMIQHLAALPTYWSGDKYLYNAGYSSSLFDRAYGEQVRDIVDLINTTSEDPAMSNMYNIARIWKVVIFHRLTDLYGAVPYAEAGLGFSDGITKPKYDSQEFIYSDMISELQSAAAALDASKASYGSADLVYGGDVDKWKKFAYSLMLRLGMRQTKVAAGKAEEIVKAAIAGGVMTSQDETAFIPHTDGPGGINRNGIGEVFMADGNQHLSETFVNWMSTLGDPRLDILSVVPNGTEHKGLPNGYDATTIKEYLGLPADESVDMGQFSDVNPVIVSNASPMMFMTYAEVELLLAEAAMRGWHSGDAATHYANGVRAAMKNWGDNYGVTPIDDAAIDAYLAANPFNEADGMRMIGEQYWAATFLNEYEAYANWRRTGFPALSPTNYPGNVTNGTIPRRLRYPQGEFGINGENINAAIAAQGPDELTTRLWWDN